MNADIRWLNYALQLAQRAKEHDEVPVGAVVVFNNEIVGEGFNQPIGLRDPTAHAEIIAMRQAAQRIGNYRLLDTTLYVTLEPCAMCAGAMIQARIKRLVFGAHDPRAGAVDSVFKILESNQLNHRTQCESGLLKEECATILREFFKKKREEQAC